jgi:hypothetical protein
MSSQNHISFITQKIQHLQTAILHCHSNSLLKLPTSLVETLYVDEVGCVWIAVNKPTQYIHEFDRSFHVGLNYYKKGTPFFLNSYGIARVVIDPEELNQLPDHLKDVYNNGKLLMSVRILEANYYENTPKAEQNIFQKCKHSLSTLFYGSSDYYHFNLEDEKNFA